MKPADLVDITPAVRYYIHPQHRLAGNPDKSIWAVDPPIEVSIFRVALDKDWIEDDRGWGLHQSGASLACLGHCCEGKRLFIAKFVGDLTNQPATWHGYPANYQSKRDDIPPKEILRAWNASGVISRRNMLQITKRQPCLS